MKTGTAVLGYLGTLALVTTLVGVLARGHHRAWVTFAVYLAENCAFAILTIVWPMRFFREQAWVVQENITNVLRFAMAIELAYRALRGFPGALSTLRWILLLVVGVTLLIVATVTGDISTYEGFVGELQPRLINGAIWLFTAIAAVVLWYRLPIRAFHKAVLISYVPYLLVFTLTQNTLAALGAEEGVWHGVWVHYANQVAYLTMVTHWAWAAWRHQNEDVRRPLRSNARGVAT